MSTYSEVIILGGFLGSGKTTLLNTLLKGLAPSSRTAVIINDFGDVNIDGMIIEKGSYSKKEISGGCICCSLKEKLLVSLASILEEEEPERVYIEATGLAVPWDMKESIENWFDSSRLRVKQVLVCVDVLQFDRFHDPLPIYKRQFCGSPHVLMTKADLHEAKIPAVEKRIRRSYPLISSLLPVARGVIDTESLPEMGAGERGSAAGLIPGLFSASAKQLLKDTIVQLSFNGVVKDSLEKLEKLILENRDDLIRVKGLLHIAGKESRVIHYDGSDLRREPFVSDAFNALVYSQAESQLTLFCLDEQKEKLESVFQGLFV